MGRSWLEELPGIRDIIDGTLAIFRTLPRRNRLRFEGPGVSLADDPLTEATVVTLSLLSASSVTMGGDVSGAAASATVVALRGKAVSATAPTSNQILIYNSGTSTWIPSALFGGDVTGTPGAASVVALRGFGVANTAPTTGQALLFNGTNWAPGAVSSLADSSVTASFSATAGSRYVVGILTAAITATLPTAPTAFARIEILGSPVGGTYPTTVQPGVTTTTTAGLTQPAVGSSVSIPVTSSTAFSSGQYVFVGTERYRLGASPDGTHILATNTGDAGNSAAGATIATAQNVRFGIDDQATDVLDAPFLARGYLFDATVGMWRRY